MKVTSNVRNIYRNEHVPITWNNAPGAANPILFHPDPVGPSGAQAATPDAITQTWRSIPSVGTWRPLGDIAESRWQAQPAVWSSGKLINGGASFTATVELPEILSMVGCPTAIFFSIGVHLGDGDTTKPTDWNCFVNVANLFANSQITNPGFLVRDAFAEFTGCVYGNLRKTLKDTRVAITVNGYYAATIFDKPNDMVHLNISGSSLSLA